LAKGLLCKYNAYSIDTCVDKMSTRLSMPPWEYRNGSDTLPVMAR